MTVLYPSSFEQLSQLARLARLRGVPFDEFWDEAVRPRRAQKTISWRVPEEERPARCVIWPSDTDIRNSDRVAVVSQREGWRRAYEGMPQTAGEAALAVLVDGLERIRLAAVPEEVPCGGPVGAELLSAA